MSLIQGTTRSAAPVLRGDARVWLAGLIALAIAVPTPIPIAGLATLNLFAQCLAVMCVFVLVPGQLSADAARRRAGDALRFLALALMLASVAGWIAGGARFGFTMASVLSLVNWMSI